VNRKSFHSRLKQETNSTLAAIDWGAVAFGVGMGNMPESSSGTNRAAPQPVIKKTGRLLPLFNKHKK